MVGGRERWIFFFFLNGGSPMDLQCLGKKSTFPFRKMCIVCEQLQTHTNNNNNEKYVYPLTFPLYLLRVWTLAIILSWKHCSLVGSEHNEKRYSGFLAFFSFFFFFLVSRNAHFIHEGGKERKRERLHSNSCSMNMKYYFCIEIDERCRPYIFVNNNNSTTTNAKIVSLMFRSFFFSSSFPIFFHLDVCTVALTDYYNCRGLQ